MAKHIFRHRLQICLLVMGLSLALIPMVQAAHFKILDPAPITFDAIRTVVTSDIPADLDRAQCGGWNFEESANDKIAVARDVPGHAGFPFANIRSGMAARDTFSFPESAKGLTTACKARVGNIEDGGTVTVDVWAGGLITNRMDVEVPYPYFEDGRNDPCLWRDRKKLTPALTETKCTEFCAYVNAFAFPDCRSVVCTLLGCLCTEWSARMTCTGQWIDDVYPNCSPCIGAQCRCQGPGCIVAPSTFFGYQNGLPIPIPVKIEEAGASIAARPFPSFWRTYHAAYSRNKVIEVPTDINQKEMNLSCYGFYDEFDPKLRATNKDDQRCVIDVNVSEYPEKQKGKGTTAPILSADPSPPVLRKPTFDPSNDLWYPNLGGGTSYINKTVFDRDFKNDLSTAILQTDTALVHTGRPFENPGKLTASAALIRATDDTSAEDKTPPDKRTVVEWWQQFETDMHKIIATPTVHLLLPPTWAFGVDSLDPLFIGTVEGGGRKDHRTEAIDVQIKAREDLLGKISGYLERNLFIRVEEEPIPVVMPLASATELRAHKQAWESWLKMKKGPDGTGTMTGEAEVLALIARLEEYAERAEAVRKLRAELPRYLSDVTKVQRDIAKWIGDWMKLNISKYKDYLVNVRERQAMRTRWKVVQQKMIDFHDKTNEPWCRNERFLVAIYSMLDPWLPGRPSLNGGTESCTVGLGLPKICVDTSRSFDLIVDLSNLRIRSGSLLRVPVLKPTLIRLAVPLPPGDEKEIKDLATLDLPALPDAPTIFADISSVLPNVILVPPLPGTIGDPPTIDLTQPRQALDAAEQIIGNMQSIYDEYWESLRAFDDGTPLECEDGPMQPLDCCGWGEQHCVHVEMDLMERVQRIGARPGILLKEDFMSKGDPLLPPSAAEMQSCNTKDHVCRPLLPEKRRSKDGWQVVFPPRDATTTGEDILFDRLRKKMRDATLSDDATEFRKIDGKKIPYKAKPEELYPIYGVMSPIDIMPRSSSSASSSASS